MSIFKSALNIFTESPSSAPQNDFVGQLVELGNAKVRVKKQIGEGGFAFVYVAQEVNSGRYFALKRLISSDADVDKTIRQEISLLKSLSGHPNVIRYLAAAAVDKSRSSHGRNEYLVVTELCSGGNLVDVLRLAGGSLSLRDACHVMYQTCRAVQHLHAQQPPVLHRDIKIENLLIGDDGLIKLCDFGSATTQMHLINHTWTAMQRSLLEDEMAKHTTPMYRAPEMLDTWNNHAITTQADIWPLGCVLFMLCFGRHPFEDAAKLRICNGNFVIPAAGAVSHQPLCPLIRGMLKVDPSERLGVGDVLEQLVAIGESLDIPLKGPLQLNGVKVDTNSPGVCASSTIGDVTSTASAAAPSLHARSQSPRRPPQPPTRPPPPPAHATTSSGAAAAVTSSSGGGGGTAVGGGLLTSLKGGAGSLFKNIVDTSKTVIQSVHQTMANKELDMSYVTSRLVVMSFPAEGIESTYRNNLEDVKAMLDSRHSLRYCVYNISGRSYNPAKFHKVVEKNCQPGRSPTLYILYWLCQDIYSYLAEHAANVAVIHCMDGKATSAVLFTALCLYSQLFSDIQQALNLFAVKRSSPCITPSQHRYLEYVRQMVSVRPPLSPHMQPVTLVSIVLQPVPLFTRNRLVWPAMQGHPFQYMSPVQYEEMMYADLLCSDGCRPYVEVWQGGEIIVSTLQQYELIPHYNPADRKVVLSLSVTLCGDVTVVVFHARRVMGRVTGVRIAQAQLHTGFIDEEDTTIRLTLDELDAITEVDRYPPGFITTLSVLVSDTTRPANFPLPWSADVAAAASGGGGRGGGGASAEGGRSPHVLFASATEMNECKQQFADVREMAGVGPSPSGPPARPPLPHAMTSTRTEHHNSQNLTNQTERGNDHQKVEQEEEETEQLSDQEDLVNVHSQTLSSSDKLGDITNHKAPSPISVDLLGLNIDSESGGASKATPPAATTDHSLFDPFGLGIDPLTAPSMCQTSSQQQQSPAPSVLHTSASTGDFRVSSPSVAASSTATSTETAGNLLGDWGTGSGSIQSGGMPRICSQPNLTAGSVKHQPPQSHTAASAATSANDPFAALGNVNTVGWNSQSSQSSTSTTNQQPAPVHSASRSTARDSSAPSGGRANYSRHHFATAKTEDSGRTGVQAPVSDDAFGDLLGSHGYSFTSSRQNAADAAAAAPKTIGQMRKQELVKDLDPDQARIVEWTEGRRGNIRALLCSLQSVVWSSCRWQSCSMHQLVAASDVKRMYRRACLAVHPDKQAGTDNEKLAKLIFVELNEAYSEFENDSVQQNMFSR